MVIAVVSRVSVSIASAARCRRLGSAGPVSMLVTAH
jgi:hypothetical protein